MGLVVFGGLFQPMPSRCPILDGLGGILKSQPSHGADTATLNGFCKPTQRLTLVFASPNTPLVAPGQIAHRIDVTKLRTLSVPVPGFGMVLRDAFPPIVEAADGMHRIFTALPSRLRKVMKCLAVAFRKLIPIIVGNPQIVLCGTMACFRCGLKQVKRPFTILRNSPTIPVKHS